MLSFGHAWFVEDAGAGRVLPVLRRARIGGVDAGGQVRAVAGALVLPSAELPHDDAEEVEVA